MASQRYHSGFLFLFPCLGLSLVSAGSPSRMFLMLVKICLIGYVGCKLFSTSFAALIGIFVYKFCLKHCTLFEAREHLTVFMASQRYHSVFLFLFPCLGLSLVSAGSPSRMFFILMKICLIGYVVRKLFSASFSALIDILVYKILGIGYAGWKLFPASSLACLHIFGFSFLIILGGFFYSHGNSGSLAFL